MILFTNRAREVAAWIEANCAEPSRYTITDPWWHDIAQAQLYSIFQPPSVEITLELSEVDQLLFDLYFAGWFIEHPTRPRWFDDTEINRAILALRSGDDSNE